MNNNENEILKQAQYYYKEIGLTVIPAHYKSKRPIHDGWNLLKPSYEELPIYFYKPELNIAAKLGIDFVVVDFDVSKDTGELPQEAQELLDKIPETWKVRTPSGGIHAYFRTLPDKPIPRMIKPIDGVDILGDGVAILPPSINKDGKLYENITNPEDGIATFPYRLLDEIISNSKNQPDSKKKDYFEIFGEGERDNALARFAGKVIGEHPEEDWKKICLPLIRDYNRQHCVPPLSDKEAEKVFRSICKTHKRNQKMEVNNMSEDVNKQEEEEKIDTSKLKPITLDEVIDTLGLTIKKDESNKVITFLCQLSAYTEDSQLNVSFNAPSSTGKSFIPMEIAKLFPEEDVMQVAYCTPTAFFHDSGTYIKETNEILVDLSRKIIVFLDQPDTHLLSRLRPVLSHDKKEVKLKITDKSQKAGLKTKNVVLRGFPSVIFCTAGLKIDEQESTRFILLSPEANQEKIREAILEKIKKESNSSSYKDLVDINPERQLLRDRILAIKQANVQDIEICSPELVEKLFFHESRSLKPRHQRDIGRVISIIKSLALLNLWFREQKGSTVVANEDDIKEGFRIWEEISPSQELNLPPYIHNIYQEIIVPLFKARIGSIGLNRREIMTKHFKLYKRPLPEYVLRQQILPMLESAGLIYQEANPNDFREKLVYPTDHEDKYSELGCGVSDNQPPMHRAQRRGMSGL